MRECMACPAAVACTLVSLFASSLASIDPTTSRIDELMKPFLNTADGYFDRLKDQGNFTKISRQRCVEGGLSGVNFCDGEADCFQKGKEVCDFNTLCKGVMWSRNWESGRRVQYCTDPSLSAHDGWNSLVKEVTNSDSRNHETLGKLIQQDKAYAAQLFTAHVELWGTLSALYASGEHSSTPDYYKVFGAQRCPENGASPGDFCAGTKSDCFSKGKAYCDASDSCVGFMWSPQWESGKRIQLCALHWDGSSTDQNGDWTALLKTSEAQPTAQEYIDWYIQHVAAFPQYLKRRKSPMQPPLDAGEDWLSVQVWLNMVLAAEAAKVDLETVTAAIEASGDYAGLIENHRIVLADNSQSQLREMAFMSDYLDAVDSSDYSIRVVTMNQYMSKLRTADGREYGVRITFSGWSGVNTFSNYWHQEDQFGAESDCHESRAPAVTAACTIAGMDPVMTAFAAVVAHEIMGHNTLDQRLAANFNEALLIRKFKVLRRGAGPDIVFGADQFSSVDREATSQHFQQKGLWDGTGRLEDAVKQYYRGDGKQYNFNCMRTGWGDSTYDFFLFAPQEFYATIANQHYSDTELMVRFAIQRALSGNIAAMDHMLLPMYYLSQSYDGQQVPFFRIGYEEGIDGVNKRLPIHKALVDVHRNEQGHIVGLSSSTRKFAFTWEVDGEGFVTKIVSTGSGTGAEVVLVKASEDMWRE